jgi:hypothetical protein
MLTHTHSLHGLITPPPCEAWGRCPEGAEGASRMFAPSTASRSPSPRAGAGEDHARTGVD